MQTMHVLPMRGSCGLLLAPGDPEHPEMEKEGLALVPEGITYLPGMYAVRASGTSMNSRIPDGWWCIFVPDSGGTRDGKIVFVEDRSAGEIERYTIKIYRSKKIALPDGGGWEHEWITLSPLNLKEHRPIKLHSGGNYKVIGWFVGCVREITHVEAIAYQCVDGAGDIEGENS